MLVGGRWSVVGVALMSVDGYFLGLGLVLVLVCVYDLHMILYCGLY